MAKIVLGIGTSHGPMLSTPPDMWHLRVQADKAGRHAFQGNTYSFDELVALRKSENLEREITPEVWKERHAACRRAITALADLFDETKPDVAVIVGNDQKEIFDDTFVPPFAVHWGDIVENLAIDEEHLNRMPPGIAISAQGTAPKEDKKYPGHPALGQHIIETLIEKSFDVASMKGLPGKNGRRGSAPHAFGFVYRQIMRDKVIPHVPVILNTFYPPSQPSIRRCYEFGHALSAAITSWPDDVRVAVIASGGLSHFTIDEALDRLVMDCFDKGSIDALEPLGEAVFQSGTSEIKNWIPVAGAMATAGLKMNVIDYVPCYRSLAGTGNAMGFVSWT